MVPLGLSGGPKATGVMVRGMRRMAASQSSMVGWPQSSMHRR